MLCKPNSPPPPPPPRLVRFASLQMSSMHVALPLMHSATCIISITSHTTIVQIFAVIARSTAEISRGGGGLIGPPPPSFSSYQNSPVFLGLTHVGCFGLTHYGHFISGECSQLFCLFSFTILIASSLLPPLGWYNYLLLLLQPIKGVNFECNVH